ncbi:hypothetical protein GGF43_004548 [Coemansia sp. RSA 2618]|nr:hypothetical protein GGF43_004548 [Coemansia sp. RSA 2618]
MGKRKDAHPSNDDRVDFIHVGTEFPSAQEQLRRRQREQRGLGDDKPKCYSRDAFKGGFSAGYFGTVGSKDGWKPTAEFVSSRNNRAQLRALRPEDFMDAEDIADLHAARVVTVEKSRPGAIGVVAVKLDHRGAGYGVDLASLPIDPDETSTEPVLPDIRAIFARKPADPTATKAKKKKPKKVDKLRQYSL